MGFTFHDHKADVEFEALGTDLAEMFSSAGEATLNTMVESVGSIRGRVRKKLSMRNPDLELLLFDFLQEIVYFKDAEYLLLKTERIEVEGSDDCGYSLRALMAGEEIDPERHEQRADVKAVTLHNFSVRKYEDGWRCRVILDV